ncbi:DUF3983 domain-containing protein [Peribacillus asahii]|nr:DUF3983 domain-containing protein [Peribacillus asahii]USK85703.1 DUF3983 domain-containing protein [Peribacillus asahii]
MTDKKKRRLRKSLVKRKKVFRKHKIDRAFRNIFVKNGVLKGQN